MLERVQDALGDKGGKGGCGCHKDIQGTGLIISGTEGGGESPAGGPGFHGRVAVKLMQRESRNGGEVIVKSGC